MKKIVFISSILCSILLSISCKTKKEGAAATPAAKQTPKIDNTIYANSVITMQRTPCFGRCPAFLVIIKGNGSVSYEGKSNVARVGKYEKQLTPEEIQKLFKAFTEADLFSLKDEYTAKVTDLPSCHLTYTHEGRTKKIHDYFEAPAKLREVEKLVDDIVNSGNWKQVN